MRAESLCSRQQSAHRPCLLCCSTSALVRAFVHLMIYLLLAVQSVERCQWAFEHGSTTWIDCITCTLLTSCHLSPSARNVKAPLDILYLGARSTLTFSSRFRGTTRQLLSAEWRSRSSLRSHTPVSILHHGMLLHCEPFTCSLVQCRSRILYNSIQTTLGCVCENRCVVEQ